MGIEQLEQTNMFHTFKNEFEQLKALAEEMREVQTVIAPLLYALSVKLYKENNEDVSLAKLVEDSIKLIEGEANE